MKKIEILTKACLLIGLYYLIYYIYSGIINPIPSLGDSWDYHIPIAINILDGNFLSHPPDIISHWHYPDTSKALTKIPQWYYPGSSEAINSLLILLHIPLTLSNIFATIVLFICLWKLALTFRLDKYYSLLFATAFCTLNVVVRWLNAVSIDIWIAIWFALSIILLEHPRKSFFYFIKLGLVLGMLIGSKYTATYFIVVLLLFYIRNLLQYINISRFLIFLIPFTIFGLFWYIRNYFLTGNPFYPLSKFGFKGPFSLNDTVLIETIRYPIEMINAAFEEYHLWIFTVLIALVVIFYQYIIVKKFTLSNMQKLFLIGLINSILYLNFPTSPQAWIMVSSFRYSLPAFIPLILATFMLAAKYRKEGLIGYIVIANMISVLTMTYYPKLILIYLPLCLLIFYFLNKNDKKRKLL
jgi:hypothetical protein